MENNKFNFMNSNIVNENEYYEYLLENFYNNTYDIENDLDTYHEYLIKCMDYVDTSCEPQFPKFLKSNIDILRKFYFNNKFKEKAKEKNIKNYNISILPIDILGILNTFDYNIIQYEEIYNIEKYNNYDFKLLCIIQKNNIDLNLSLAGLLKHEFLKRTYYKLSYIREYLQSESIKNCDEKILYKKLQFLTTPNFSDSKVHELIRLLKDVSFDFEKINNPDYGTILIRRIYHCENSGINYNIIKNNNKYMIETSNSKTITGDITKQEGYIVNFLNLKDRENNPTNIYFDEKYNIGERIHVDRISFNDSSYSYSKKNVIELNEKENFTYDDELKRFDVIYLKDKKVFNVFINYICDNYSKTIKNSFKKIKKYCLTNNIKKLNIPIVYIEDFKFNYHKYNIETIFANSGIELVFIHLLK